MPAVVVNNPYRNVNWESYGQYKADHHVHSRGFGDEPADVLDVLADGQTLNGVSLSDDEKYRVLGAGSQAEDESAYWGPAESCPDCGYYNMSERDSDYSDRDPEELGVDGIISFPSQEIDDVEHICHLFAFSSPQDFDYYPGTGGSSGNFSDFEEALQQVIEDTDNTVVEGRGQTVIAHPTRYMDSVSDWTRYQQFFEDYSVEDGLLGLEIFTKALNEQGDHYEDGFDLSDVFETWDNLLQVTMPERNVFGFAANDCNNGDWGDGSGPDLRWWTVMLSEDEFDPSDQQASRLALKKALEEGRFYINMRSPYSEEPPETPVLEYIEIKDNESVIELSVDWPNDEEGSIDWYSNGEVVETGEKIILSEEHIPYVRAHIYTNNPDGQIATQAFGIEDVDNDALFFGGGIV